MPATSKAVLTCDGFNDCEAPATTAFDREGHEVPVGSAQDVQHFCAACLLRILETQGGAYAGCD